MVKSDHATEPYAKAAVTGELAELVPLGGAAILGGHKIVGHHKTATRWDSPGAISRDRTKRGEV